MPLSHWRPKLIGKARPATNGIRTSTKYIKNVAERGGKVNLGKHSKDAFGISVFWMERGVTPEPGVVKLVFSK